MRVLFYTATAFFIVLAGVFVFYALQAPEHAGGAKVVLSIDSREAPGGATANAQEPERDLYAEAAARLQRVETEKAQGNPGGEETAVAEDAGRDQLGTSPDRQGVGNVERVEAVRSQRVQTRSEADAKNGSEEIPDPPPGTALAGLDNDKPLFKSIGQDEEAVDAPDNLTSTAAEAALPGTQLESRSVPREERRFTSANPNREAGALAEEQQQAATPNGLRLRQDSAADGAPATGSGQKPGLDAILAALNEREGQAETAAAAPAGPPPLPLRRSVAKTAAVNGWGSTKITASDAGASKPARIAILVRGVGRDDRNSSDAVTKLPPAISLAFMPHAGAAQQWARKAAEQGHEVIVQLPLEPTDYPANNPGPETLLASSSVDQNAARLGTILARFEGYSGVTNFLGGRMLQSKDALRPILEEIKSRGLIYVGEGNTKSHAIVRGLAGEVGLRYGGANVMIDAQPAPAAIQAALERLVAIARKEGSAIGLGYASRATIEQLEAWTQTLGAQGVTLVPVGTLAQTPGAS